MPHVINIKTGKDAGYFTPDEWQRVKSDRRYAGIFQAKEGLDDLPEVQALYEEQKQEAKTAQRKQRKPSPPPIPESQPGETFNESGEDTKSND